MLLTARRQPELGTYDLWRLDLVRHTEERLTETRGSEHTPMWIDGDRAVVYVADSGGGVPHLFRKDLSSGVEEPLLPSGPQQLATDVVPDGSAVIYLERTLEGRFDIFRLSLTAGAEPEALLRTRQSKLQARISPDGRAMAFLASDEELGRDLYIVSLPMSGAPVVAAANIEGPPRWSADGSTLYYVGAERTMMALAVTTAPTLSVGSARRLFEMKRPAEFLDVSRDGRFLMLVTEVSANEQPVIVSTAGIDPER
jgi:Tol biopolymer transport system component